jgi:hypothetical protein
MTAQLAPGARESLDDFTLAYIEAALFSTNDDRGEPLDRNYTVEDIADQALSRMIEDCAAFQSRDAWQYVTCTFREYAIARLEA